MNKQNYTSIELSKKLAKNGCVLDSNFAHVDGEVVLKEYWETVDGEWGSCRDITHNIKDKRDLFAYRSYDILNDICVKYAKEFFGEDALEYKTKYDSVFDTDEYVPNPTEEILSLLQQNRKQEAEDYIWGNCKFNPANT